jgi:uncharacterized protein (DUF488 family)
LTFYTIGHSNRTIEAFIALLLRNRIALVADVRSFPHSRTQPQFDLATLPASLHERGLAYRHLPALGGRRVRSRGDSPNGGWLQAGFRNYADYMGTEAFSAGLAELLAIAQTHQVAYMCAEAVPWRCHRRLISDCLVAKGHEVFDILGDAPARPHRLTPFARKGGPCVIYPAERAHEG